MINILRIWIIFEISEKMKTVTISTYSIMLCEATMFAFFAIVVIVWEASHPFSVTEFGESFDNNKRIKMCTSDHSEIYVSVLFAGAGIIMLLGTFVTFKV